MNYGQVRDQALKLLNQYSIAGTKVEPDYNNQQDYLSRIPALVNDAMMEIATTSRKIPALLELDGLARWDIGEQVCYELPEDFFQLISGDIYDTKEGRVAHTNCVRLRGRKCLLVPKQEAGSYTVGYYRYPALLSDTPADTDELDNEPETHWAIAFYVAAYLVQHDDLSLCALFNNKYEDKLSKLSAGLASESCPTDDVYDFFSEVG